MAWHDEVFDGKYDRFTFHLFTPERSEREAEFIRTALRLRPGEEVLDLACGQGRHALPLARRGIRITGLDRYERFLEMARAVAGELPVEFVAGDMRTIEFDGRFDAAYCYFTSFGFFDDATNFDVLRRLARALRPGGRFLLDLQNRENYTSGEPVHQEFTEFEQDVGRRALLSSTTYETNTGVAHLTLKLYGGHAELEEMSFSVRLYTLPELRWLLQQAGMEIERAYGDCDGSAYQMASPRLIAVAYKV